MIKLLVVSDVHGDSSSLNLLYLYNQDFDYYLDLGDSCLMPYEIAPFVSVKGNNDWSLDLPKEARLVVEGVSIFITHGQYFGYFNRELAMNDILTRNHCQVLISGHTHMPMFQKDGSFYYINPGSTTLPRGGSARSYAVLFIDNGKLDFRLKEIQK